MNSLSPITIDQSFRDPGLKRRFGNLTTSTKDVEVLLAAREYVEQDSQAQRSVISTDDEDQEGGDGASRVRITYLTSAYELKIDDVDLGGTTRVPTTATDIRFVERFQVIKGSAAVGAIKLLETASGPQNEFCGIGVGTYDAFLCHHYVPAGRSGYVHIWGASVNADAKLKLIGRGTYGTDLVDEHWDLVNLEGISSPPGLLVFGPKRILGVPFAEKSYIRMTVVPQQDSVATTIRGELIVWEDED